MKLNGNWQHAGLQLAGAVHRNLNCSAFGGACSIPPTSSQGHGSCRNCQLPLGPRRSTHPPCCGPEGAHALPVGASVAGGAVCLHTYCWEDPCPCLAPLCTPLQLAFDHWLSFSQRSVGSSSVPDSEINKAGPGFNLGKSLQALPSGGFISDPGAPISLLRPTIKPHRLFCAVSSTVYTIVHQFSRKSISIFLASSPQSP